MISRLNALKKRLDELFENKVFELVQAKRPKQTEWSTEQSTIIGANPTPIAHLLL
jgi:hypothetical protein